MTRSRSSSAVLATINAPDVENGDESTIDEARLDVLATLESARGEMSALRGSTYGAVRLACMSSVAGAFVSRLIDRFGKPNATSRCA
jgi:hypothetical protein